MPPICHDSISHELRTPLHGVSEVSEARYPAASLTELCLILQILAAAELLADSGLTQSQRSYLQTVEACGTSLVETVNHVLDFSKLSGASKSMSIKRTSSVLSLHMCAERSESQFKPF